MKKLVRNFEAQILRRLRNLSLDPFTRFLIDEKSVRHVSDMTDLVTPCGSTTYILIQRIVVLPPVFR